MRRYFEEVGRSFGVKFADLAQDSGLVPVAGFDVFAEAFLADVLVAAGTVVAFVALLHMLLLARI